MVSLDLEALVPDKKVLEDLKENTETYDEYKVILYIQSANEVKPLELTVYMTKEEASESSRYLNNVLISMVRNNAPTSISITVRNSKHEIVSYGLLGVVGIIHNIPEYEIE